MSRGYLPTLPAGDREFKYVKGTTLQELLPRGTIVGVSSDKNPKDSQVAGKWCFQLTLGWTVLKCGDQKSGYHYHFKTIDYKVPIIVCPEENLEIAYQNAITNNRPKRPNGRKRRAEKTRENNKQTG